MIHIVIGTRAQMFKMAPVMLECDRRGLQWRWIYVAQHKDTMDATIDTFGLPEPAYTVVKWETEANTLTKYGYWMFRAFGKLFIGKKILDGYTGKKHIVLTHGDTTSTVWGALLGKLFRCKVMHVESGLRSFNMFNPFPEEINRLLTFRLSDYYICPGQSSIDNLEKYKGIKINTVFNTQADTIAFGLENYKKLGIKTPKHKYAVVSTHRFENIFSREKFENIIRIIEQTAESIPLFFVLHPATEKQLNKFSFMERLKANDKITLLPRQEYLPFINLISSSEFVMTDGGGNQEELYFMGKPTLLLRMTTERPDELGKTAVLSKFDNDVIKKFVKEYKKYSRDRVIVDKSPSAIIVDELEKFSH